ncbi:MAG: hypothetical protein A2W26_07370 [Acidobacteria bacterium RBG_16_64_8]|nr:MAG: hypothetical protein A2W26_07370 [Acidobacteria bacterium RBG_16_64_8]
MTHVRGIKVTGGTLPAVIWATFMRRALQSAPVLDFSPLSGNGWASVAVCSKSDRLPTQYCPSVVEKLFRADRQPTESCTLHSPRKVSVPDVVGLQLDDAQTDLNTAGLKVSVVDDAASLEATGTVLNQGPVSGSIVVEGSEVTLVVSAAKPTTVVPAVAGLDATTARTMLAAAGLLSQETTIPDQAAAGTMLSQDLAPGTEVQTGSAVHLVTSSGPEPPSTEWVRSRSGLSG